MILPLVEYYVKELSKILDDSNRNITSDNWFAFVSLAKELLINHKLTFAGMLRLNKYVILF